LSRKSLSLEELEQLKIEPMTIDNSEPLKPDDLMDLLAKAITREAEAKEDIATIRDMLAVMRKEGLIGDELSSPELTLKWQTRSTWQYSSAIKTAQDLEKLEGIATQKTSEGWVTRKNKNDSLF
jgi:hypothetical protein